MAIGDAAAAAGLTTYTSAQDRRLGYQNDNQRGDDIAAVMARAKTLEASVIGTPMFSVAKSSNGQSVAGNVATYYTSGAWGTPIKNRGGFIWSGGALTVPRAGIYGVSSTQKLEPNDYYSQYVGVTRNISNAENLDYDSFVARTAMFPGERGSNTSNLVAPTITASRLLVALNAGDVLRVVGYQSNYGQNTVRTDDGATSLTFEVEWKSDL